LKQADFKPKNRHGKQAFLGELEKAYFPPLNEGA